LLRKSDALQRRMEQASSARATRLHAAALRLNMLDPKLVLARGCAWLSDAQGRGVESAQSVQPGQQLQAQLRDGRLTLQTLGVQTG